MPDESTIDAERYRPFQVVVVMGESAFGNPEPRLEFVFEEGLPSFRTVQACLYLFASWVELHAREDDRFVVVVDLQKRNVHLELAYDPVDKLVAMDRAMVFLRSVSDDVNMTMLWRMGAGGATKGTT